jgi:capsular polysaccharide biosynthesis protein
MPENNSKSRQSQDLTVARVCHRRKPVRLVPGDEPLFAAEMRREIGPARLDQMSRATLLESTLLGEDGPGFGLGRLISLGLHDRYRCRQELRAALRRQLSRLRSATTIEAGLWVIDDWTHGYFHWLTEGLAKIELARSEGVAGEILLPPSYERYRYIAESLDLLGLPFRYLPRWRMARIERLSRPRFEVVTGNFNCHLIRRLAARLRLGADSIAGGSATAEAGKAGRRLWISRARAGKRRIANEPALQAVLNRHGFETIYPEELSFAAQANCFSEATLIGGLHGAGLTNMLFMPPGTRVLEIRRRDDDHSNCYFALASSLQLDYHYLLADPLGTDPHASDCHLAPDALDHLLNHL